MQEGSTVSSIICDCCRLLTYSLMAGENQQSGICLYVCLSDIKITFESLRVKKLHFWSVVHLHGIRIKFVYEGHRVKVTGAKECEFPIPAM